MPYYTLWRASDNVEFGPISARDDGEAAAIFSKDLGVFLTLEEGPMVAPYMMGRSEIDKGPAWRKSQDIPIWVRDAGAPTKCIFRPHDFAVEDKDGPMATYPKIQERVCDNDGFVPKTCWIAHVMSDHGLTKRQAANRINSVVRKHPCPENRRPAIIAALRHFGMIR